MAAGNNTLEETFGLVTAGTEILREPGRVANRTFNNYCAFN